jgi:hypothetical protein
LENIVLVDLYAIHISFFLNFIMTNLCENEKNDFKKRISLNWAISLPSLTTNYIDYLSSSPLAEFCEK